MMTKHFLFIRTRRTIEQQINSLNGDGHVYQYKLDEPRMYEQWMNVRTGPPPIMFVCCDGVLYYYETLRHGAEGHVSSVYYITSDRFRDPYYLLHEDPDVIAREVIQTCKIASFDQH